MQGVVIIAFGKEYDKLAAYTVGYSQRFTDLPFCIMTNIQERHPKWGGCENVEFKYFDMKDGQNRILKTMLIDHTPFDTTMYMDCDALIQKKGIERAFNFDQDIMFNEYCSWAPGEKIPRLYSDIFKKNQISRRVSIFSGGCFIFKKNERVFEFFNMWNRTWRDEGRGREMHCLAVSGIKSGINYGTFPGLFEPDTINEEALVQHKFGRWHEKFAIPQITENKSCMSIHSSAEQWNLVEFL